MEEKIIDLDEVLERVQDDRELLLELFDIFTQDYALKIEKLRSAIQAKNFENIKELVHSIKGAAGNISAIALHSTCQKIELLAQAQDLITIQQTILVLETQFAHLQQRIVEIKNQFKK